jgi:hypothetical protein
MATVVQASQPVVEATPVRDDRPRRSRPTFSVDALSPRFIELLGLALGIGLVVAATLDRTLSTDVFWSMAAGQSILTHHALFGTDAFTYTEPHRRWIADEWGSEVVLASLFRLFGTAAYNIFSIATGAAILVCTRAYMRSLGARGGRVAIALFLLSFGLLGVVTQDRGLSFSLIWLPVELLVLTKARRQARWLWALPPLFVLWVNTHGSVLLGLLVLGVELGWSMAPDRWLVSIGGTGRSPYPRQLGVVLAVSFVAACVSPYGPSLLRYDLGVSLNSQIGQYIQEWQSPNFHSLLALVSFGLPLVVLLLVIRTRRLMVLEVSLAIVFVVTTLHATRFIAYLYIAACGLAACLPRRAQWSERSRLITGALGVGVLIAILAAPAVPAGSVSSDTPVQAFSFLQGHGGRIFTQYVWGDYSIARHRATFADGRTDYFSGPVLTQFFDVSNLTVDPDPVLSHYQVSYVVWPRGTPLYAYLSHDPTWEVVDRTAPAVVFARRSAWSAPGRAGS